MFKDRLWLLIPKVYASECFLFPGRQSIWILSAVPDCYDPDRIISYLIENCIISCNQGSDILYIRLDSREMMFAKKSD